MSIKVKITNRFFGRKFLSRVKKNFSSELKRDIGDAIVDEILQGKSPVRNHKFKQYSDSYAEVKGRKRPVDMLKSGDMLESIKVKQNRSGKVEVSFSDEKAYYHQKGKGRLPVRKLLPLGRDLFNIKLTKLIRDILIKAFRKAR